MYDPMSEIKRHPSGVLHPSAWPSYAKLRATVVTQTKDATHTAAAAAFASVACDSCTYGYCCRIVVDVSTSDVAALVYGNSAYIRRMWHQFLRRAVEERELEADDVDVLAGGGKPADRRARNYCAFFDAAAGRCLAYATRPLGCAGYHVQGVDNSACAGPGDASFGALMYDANKAITAPGLAGMLGLGEYVAPLFWSGLVPRMHGGIALGVVRLVDALVRVGVLAADAFPGASAFRRGPVLWSDDGAEEWSRKACERMAELAASLTADELGQLRSMESEVRERVRTLAGGPKGSL